MQTDFDHVESRLSSRVHGHLGLQLLQRWFSYPYRCLAGTHTNPYVETITD